MKQSVIVGTLFPFIALGGCAVSSEGPSEVLGKNSTELHGTLARDTLFPAVGLVMSRTVGFNRNCTGTLIGPRTVMLAAHCVAPVARGCDKSVLLAGMSFTLTPNGDPNDAAAVSYQLEDIRTSAAAYSPRLFDCNDGSRCSTPFGDSITTEAASPGGVRISSDIAFLRIKEDRTKPPPNRVATPLRVLTSVSGGQSFTANAVRASIDVGARLGANYQNGALAISDPDLLKLIYVYTMEVMLYP